MKKFLKVLGVTVVILSVFGVAFFSFLGYLYGEDDLDWEY